MVDSHFDASEASRIVQQSDEQQGDASLSSQAMAIMEQEYKAKLDPCKSAGGSGDGSGASGGGGRGEGGEGGEGGGSGKRGVGGGAKGGIASHRSESPIDSLVSVIKHVPEEVQRLFNNISSPYGDGGGKRRICQ